MRKGGGKSKGSQFEREVCRILSLWVTNGNRADVFWRSAMSGGRATVGRKKGQDIRQAGDMTATAPEGNAFVEMWLVECKFVQDLELVSFLLNNTGKLATYWKKCKAEARAHQRRPMLICKQNFLRDILVVVPMDDADVDYEIRSWSRRVDICKLGAVVKHYRGKWEMFKC